MLSNDDNGLVRVALATSSDGLLRARAVSSTTLCRALVARHKPGPLGAHVMSRAATVAALYPFSHKHHDRVSLQWTGEGPLRSALVDVRALAEDRVGIRATLGNKLAAIWGSNPRSNDIGRALMPRGQMTVLHQEPTGRTTQGQVELHDGSIDDDTAAYFTQSEQVITRVRVRVDIDEDAQIVHAAGVLVQALPGCSDDRLQTLQRMAIEVSAADDAETLLRRVLGDDATQQPSSEALFFCPCTKERALAGIAMLDRDSIIDMIAIDKGAEVTCEMCATQYRFSAEEMLPLLDAMDAQHKTEVN
jgi:molecular chaperone Hsp33